MSDLPIRDRSRVVALLCVVALAASVAAGCSGGGGGGGSTGYGGGAKGSKTGVADSAKAVSVPIVAADGGSVGLKTADGALVRVTFPLETLAKDMTIVATPLTTAPMQDAGTVEKGFLLEEKGTGAGPKLAHPAYIEMLVPGTLPDDAAMVSYRPDGTFEVLPTKIKTGKGVTAVFALATHFSPTGMRGVGKDKAKKSRTSFSDYNWVVYINNKQSMQTGPLKQTVTLKLRAVNTGGDIAGDYSGNAAINSTNDGNMAGGTITSPQAGNASVKITLTEGDPLASLTGDKPDPLATLTPTDMPSWSGTGSIQMSTMAVAGSATGQIGGYSGTGATGNNSNLPVEMIVTGTQVQLRVSLPPGPATFSGYVIGEGK